MSEVQFAGRLITTREEAIEAACDIVTGRLDAGLYNLAISWTNGDEVRIQALAFAEVANAAKVQQLVAVAQVLPSANKLED